MPIGMIAIGIFFPAWTLWLLTPAFLMIGLTCTVNALRCGRLHCLATGPLFLVAALLYGLVGAGLLPEGWVGEIGGGLLVGVALAYGAELLLGRRYLARS
ncbi:MAG: hypothetical protein ACREK7_01810 [Gemmatimonadota bacterium]